MIEAILKIDKVNQRHWYAFLLGILYTVIGAITAFALFRDFTSLATLFFTTLLLVPTLMKYLSQEEKIESKEGLCHFAQNHSDIIEVYLYLFLGIFVVYMVLGVLSVNSSYGVLSYQQDFLAKSGVTEKIIETMPASNFNSVVNILNKNLLVAVVAFLLSIVYGAGSIFLIIFNASIFATFIITIAGYVTKSIPKTFLFIVMFLIHVLPEVLGFLLAAIAGGVVSKALLDEQFAGREFSNVIKDATILFLISILLIIIAAFLEVYVTRNLFGLWLGA